MSDVEPRRPSVRDLFVGFFGIGIVGFGGVLPWARRMMVEQRGWLTPADFTDVLALCQILPGPNIVNMAVALGARFQGLVGALAAITGLLLAPFAIIIALGTLYGEYGQWPIVRHAFTGLAAAASGLVIAMAIKIASPLRSLAQIGVALLAFGAIAMGRLPLLPTLAVLAPISILLQHRIMRRQQAS